MIRAEALGMLARARGQRAGHGSDIGHPDNSYVWLDFAPGRTGMS